MNSKHVLSLLFLLSLNSFASAPFASGKSGDLEWQVRFNLPECSHTNQKKNVWCLSTDSAKAQEISGVADELVAWTKDNKVKSLHLAYFSFSNKTIRKALCDASAAGKNVNVYLDQSNAPELTSWFRAECTNSSNIKVTGLGVTFGTVGGHLQHAKVFLASEQSELKSASEMNELEKQKALGNDIRFSSSSANMSSGGLSIHFENWLMFKTGELNNLAQQNICMFKSFEKTANTISSNPRSIFSQTNKECIAKIESKKISGVDFFVVPSAADQKKPFAAMKSMIEGAKTSIRISIHRLTTSQIYKSLFERADKKGVDIKIIFDDDNLRTGVEDGGDAHDVGSSDVAAYRSLRDRTKAEISFMETNAITVPSAGGVPQLFHNKFIIVDSKILFQGAGNFTTKSLNIGSDGNYEHFYVIKIPEIVNAYERGWNKLRSLSTLRADHPVGDHRDIDLSDLGNF